VRTLKKNKKSLKSFLFGLPSGYSDWAIHTSKMDIHAWQQIFQNYLAPNDRASLLNGYVANSIAPKFFNEVPIYYINDLPNVPTASLFLSPISHILETEVFKKDLTRLCKGQPAYKKKWQTTQEKLKLNPVMVHLEKITQNYYSVQLDYEARVGLERSTNWIAIAADHHDKLYKRLNNRS
jgi:hypothetical protein